MASLLEKTEYAAGFLSNLLEEALTAGPSGKEGDADGTADSVIEEINSLPTGGDERIRPVNDGSDGPVLFVADSQPEGRFTLLTDRNVIGHMGRITNANPFSSSGIAEGGIFDRSLFGEGKGSFSCDCGSCHTEGAVCDKCGTMAENRGVEGNIAYIDLGGLPNIHGREDIIAASLGLTSAELVKTAGRPPVRLTGGKILNGLLVGTVFLKKDVLSPETLRTGEAFSFGISSAEDEKEGITHELVSGPPAFELLVPFMGFPEGKNAVREAIMSNSGKADSYLRATDFSEVAFFHRNREKLKDLIRDTENLVNMRLERGIDTPQAENMEDFRLDVSPVRGTVTLLRADDEGDFETKAVFSAVAAHEDPHAFTDQEGNHLLIFREPEDGSSVLVCLNPDEGILWIRDGLAAGDSGAVFDSAGLDVSSYTPASPDEACLTAFRAALAELTPVEGKHEINRIIHDYDLQAEATEKNINALSELRTEEERLHMLYSTMDSFMNAGYKPADLIMHFFPVAPPSVRKPVSAAFTSSVEGRLGPLNSAYMRMISLMETIRTLEDAGAAENGGTDTYRELTSILYGEMAKAVRAAEDMMSTKHGMVRTGLDAYSAKDFARGAIIVNPDLDFGTIGLPATLVFSLFRQRITGLYERKKAEEPEGFWASVDFTDEIARESKAALRLIEEAIHSDNPREDPMVILSRQPILSGNSVRVAKIRLITGDAVEMNPDFLHSMNADCDGDVLRFTPVTESARIRRALSELSHQNYSPSGGNFMSYPTNEALLGLYGATEDSHELSFAHDVIISDISKRDADGCTVVSAFHVILRGEGTDPCPIGELMEEGEVLFTDRDGKKITAPCFGSLEKAGGEGCFCFADTVTAPDYIIIPPDTEVTCHKGDFIPAGTPLTTGYETKELDVSDILSFTFGRDKDGYPSIIPFLKLDGLLSRAKMSFTQAVGYHGVSTTPGRISLMYHVGLDETSSYLSDPVRCDLFRSFAYHCGAFRAAGGDAMLAGAASAEWAEDRGTVIQAVRDETASYLSAMGSLADERLKELSETAFKAVTVADGAFEGNDAELMNRSAGEELRCLNELFTRLLEVNTEAIVRSYAPLADRPISKKTIGEHYLKFQEMHPSSVVDETMIGIFNRRMFREGFWFADHVPGLTFSEDALLSPDMFRAEDELRKRGLEGASDTSRTVAWENEILPALTEEIEKKHSSYSNNPISRMVKSGAKGNWTGISAMAGARGAMRDRTKTPLSLGLVALKFGSAQVTDASSVGPHGINLGIKGNQMNQVGRDERCMRNLMKHQVITEDDCGTERFESIALVSGQGTRHAEGHTLAHDVSAPDGHLILRAGDVLTAGRLSRLKAEGITGVDIRTAATCRCSSGCCSKCYGADYSLGPLSEKPIALKRTVGFDAVEAVTADIAQESMDKAKKTGPPSSFSAMDALGDIIDGRDLTLLMAASEATALGTDGPAEMYRSVYGHLDRIVPAGVGRRHVENVAALLFGIRVTDEDGKSRVVNIREYNRLEDEGKITSRSPLPEIVYADIDTLIRLMAPERSVLSQGGRKVVTSLAVTQASRWDMAPRQDTGSLHSTHDAGR